MIWCKKIKNGTTFRTYLQSSSVSLHNTTDLQHTQTHSFRHTFHCNQPKIKEPTRSNKNHDEEKNKLSRPFDEMKIFIKAKQLSRTYGNSETHSNIIRNVDSLLVVLFFFFIFGEQVHLHENSSFISTFVSSLAWIICFFFLSLNAIFSFFFHSLFVCVYVSFLYFFWRSVRCI